MEYRETNNNINPYGSPDYNYNGNNNPYSQPQQPQQFNNYGQQPQQFNNYGQQPNYPTYTYNNLQNNGPSYNNNNGPPHGIINPYNQNQQTILVTYGNRPNQMQLSHCNLCCRQTTTWLKTKNGGLVWLMCCLFFCFTGCLCFIPFLIDSWKDKQYRCTVCNNIKFKEKGGC